MNNTVLIVDDMKINIDSLTNILRPNYSVMAAISGENAIKLLNRKQPDIVLLDLSMPDIDGFDVLQYMKEQPELVNIPVIFVTAEINEESEEKGLELGAVDYIKKPFNEAVVKAKVRNHLELKNYRDNLELIVYERTKDLEERTRQLAASHEAIIMGMSLMSENHDKITGDHIRRIKDFTRILAYKLLEIYPDMLTEDVANLIVLYSTLHDVGKVAISDAVLKKPGKLTPEEFVMMEMHTVNGADLLRETEDFLVKDKDTQDLRVAIEIAEGHHEKYNGMGYPHKLKGDEIPLSARIVSIVDIYDALRSPRQYKKEFSYEETLEIMLVGDGRTSPEHFDPRVLEAFKNVHDEFEKVLESNKPKIIE
jgi:putative two-component system response regulator